MSFSPILLLLPLMAMAACQQDVEVLSVERNLPKAQALSEHCSSIIGEPRVEEVAPGIFVAIAYDLANTILIQTPDGNVVVDVSMSPSRAREAKAALDLVAPGPVKAIIYTHSHIDHVGGAEVWAEPDTKIWATDRLVDHFFKQYGLFLGAENQRGVRQFGRDISEKDLPCSALGRRPDMLAVYEQGVLMPTDTFSGKSSIEVGGVSIEMIEAHGETHDQLFVWLPKQRILLPGDNWYRSFPNLYTIRGSAPRPVDDWIRSLDAMRALSPEIMIPSHTIPVRGETEVAQALTNYRDAIQWIRDSVVRGANGGKSVDDIAATVALPSHLARDPALVELYGEIPWSARAIYSNYLGWFDGKAHNLYGMVPKERAERYIAALGGLEALWKQIEGAQKQGQHKWALELLAHAQASEQVDQVRLNAAFALSYAQLAGSVANSNGRAYLLQSALERERHLSKLPEPVFSEDFVQAIPLKHLFEILSSKLKPHLTMDAHRSLRWEFSDHEAVNLTIRRGIAELTYGLPLPGTPAPEAILKMEAATWRKLSLKVSSPLIELASGALKVEGDEKALLEILGLFHQGIGPGVEPELP